jgi:hypothetical protein
MPTSGRPDVTWPTWEDGDVADNPSDETASTESGTERPAPRTVRGRLGMRDMLLSMVVLGVGVVIAAAITQGFSFSPGGAASNTSNVQPVDVSAELRAAAGQVKFPLREPRPPAGWRANSDSVSPIGTEQAVRIGWITPGGRYLQLSQSNASAADLVRSAAGLGRDISVSATGTETVNGTQWTVYPGIRSELSWVTDLGQVKLFITGNGTTGEFRTLAVAAMTGHLMTAA